MFFIISLKRSLPGAYFAQAAAAYHFSQGVLNEIGLPSLVYVALVEAVT